MTAAIVVLRTSATVRSLLTLLFAAAIAQSLPVSINALYAKDEFGASDVTVTVLFATLSLAKLLTVLAIGHRADARSARRPLIRLSIAWLALGYLAMSVADALWQMFAIGLLFYVAGGVLAAQLFAMVREATAQEGEAVVVTAFSRMVFSLGYISGAPLGALVAMELGARSALRAAAFVLVACLVVALLGLRERVGGEESERAATDEERAPRSRRYWLLVYFSVTCVLLSSGRVMQLAMLPIVLRDEMHASLYWIGVALAIPPLLELALMPLAAAASVRWGSGPVFLVGCVAIVVYYAGVTFAEAPWMILLNQSLYAIYGAAGIMLGIDIAQRMLPDRVNTATSVYLGHEHAAAVVGSVLAVGAVGLLGPQHGFAVPLLLCSIGLAVVLRFRREWFARL